MELHTDTDTRSHGQAHWLTSHSMITWTGTSHNNTSIQVSLWCVQTHIWHLFTRILRTYCYPGIHTYTLILTHEHITYSHSLSHSYTEAHAQILACSHLLTHLLKLTCGRILSHALTLTHWRTVKNHVLTYSYIATTCTLTRAQNQTLKQGSLSHIHTQTDTDINTLRLTYVCTQHIQAHQTLTW